MRIAVYGGSFNPPHVGHILAAKAAYEQLKPDKMLIIPDYEAPHKDMAPGSPSPEQRLELCRLSFAELKGAEISDMELRRRGKSYTSDTLRCLLEQHPGAEIYLIIGTDMLCTFEQWHDFRWILDNAVLAAQPREEGDGEKIARAAQSLREKYGARVETIAMTAVPCASTDVRKLLQDGEGCALLNGDAYAYIIRNRLYGAKVQLQWLRQQAYAMLKPKRIPHVQGCEEEAVRLAKRWGADERQAAEAGILHDITKKLELDEQLILCAKYGIIADNVELASPKLLHSKTGAAIARAEFGESEEVCQAICWHTTGRANMSLLEKILYMADYIEPNRCFDGVETLRKLAYEDLDKALVLGMEMSLEDLRSYGVQPHENTVAALNWYKKEVIVNEAQREQP
jgi:nicotinate-nucleotide adenylyltransferase